MFEATGEPFDQIPMFVLMRIENTRLPPILARRDHCRGTFLSNDLDQRLGIVGFVGNDGLRGNAIEYRLGLRHIVNFDHSTTRRASMKFELPPLPYTTNALEPHISARTFGIQEHPRSILQRQDALLADIRADAGAALIDEETANRYQRHGGKRRARLQEAAPEYRALPAAQLWKRPAWQRAGGFPRGGNRLEGRGMTRMNGQPAPETALEPLRPFRTAQQRYAWWRAMKGGRLSSGSISGGLYTFHPP